MTYSGKSKDDHVWCIVKNCNVLSSQSLPRKVGGSLTRNSVTRGLWADKVTLVLQVVGQEWVLLYLVRVTGPCHLTLHGLTNRRLNKGNSTPNKCWTLLRTIASRHSSWCSSSLQINRHNMWVNWSAAEWTTNYFPSISCFCRIWNYASTPSSDLSWCGA